MKRRIFNILSVASAVLCVGWLLLPAGVIDSPPPMNGPIPVAVSAILPTVWLYLWWRDRKLGLPGHCHHCGYDLSASTDECPECGEPIRLCVTCGYDLRASKDRCPECGEAIEAEQA